MACEPSRQGINLLRFRTVRGVALSPLFPYLLQAGILAVFVVLAVLGWGIFAPEGVPSKQLAQTNLVTLLIWGLWWPAMVWAAVLFGRAWCGACPLELLASITERIGRRLGIRQRVLGRWLRSGFLIVGLYFLIQMLIPGAHLHRVPAYTSFFLLSLLSVAAIVGLMMKDRAFCRGFCPVGLLLSAYGRGGVLAVRASAEVPCTVCDGKECRSHRTRNRLDARSCPSLLNPPALDNNSECLLCLQCVKACPAGNMGLFLRRPFSLADAREPLASWPITLFLLVVTGYVSYQLSSEWNEAQGAFLWPPRTVAAWLGLPGWTGWIRGIWTLLVVPLALWTLLATPAFLLRRSGGFGQAWRSLALPMAVILAGGHMAKGLAKFVEWAGYVPLVYDDPSGIRAAGAIGSGVLSTPAPLLSKALVSTASLVLLAVMAYFALRESKLAHPATHSSRVPSLILATLLSAVLIFGWRFSP